MDLQRGGIRAVVLGAGRADPAVPAAPCPIYGDRVPLFDAAGVRPEPSDDAGPLVTERERKPEPVLLGREVHDVLVRVANAGGGHPEQDLARPGCGVDTSRISGGKPIAVYWSAFTRSPCSRWAADLARSWRRDKG